MSFDARETSIAGGQPIRLYEFQRGVLRWRYTSADREIEYQTQSFSAVAISDDGIRQGESGADALKITVPWDLPVARLFRSVPPSAEIDVIVRDLHYGESEGKIRFHGTIDSVRHPSPAIAEILCQPLDASLEQPGLRLGWERACPYSLYDHNCGVNPSTFGVEAILTTVTPVLVSAGAFDALADGYFAGGFVEWSIGSGEVERRAVETHVGEQLTLMGGTDGIVAGQAITAYPGCPRTIAICDSRFSNKDNYGGIPHLPGKSPFTGDPIF